jgi:hypothetical protein
MPAGEAPAAAAGKVDEGSDERPPRSFGADAAPLGSLKLEGRGSEKPASSPVEGLTFE